MVKQTLIKNGLDILAEEYLDYADKYFTRTRIILENEGINPRVRYQAFARKGGEVRGLDESVNFIREVTRAKAKDEVRIYALRNGDNYAPCEPLMKLEGRVQDLVELETLYLGLTSSGLTGNINIEEVRKKARAIVNAAQGKPVHYFGARHFHPLLDREIAGICKEEGFTGCSTDKGAEAWNAGGMGTEPHALIVTYASYMDENRIKGNPTVEATKGFDKHIGQEVPRIVLPDTFNREITDSIETARAVPSLRGLRIDTCGENYAQGADRMPEEGPAFEDGENWNFKGYWNPKGVSISAVWNLREALIRNGLANLEITVSSGFNEEKTAVFLEADAFFRQRYGLELFHSIGTGSIARPVMATADIVAYFNEKQGKWVEMHKVGRPEIKTNRLREVK